MRRTTAPEPGARVGLLAICALVAGLATGCGGAASQDDAGSPAAKDGPAPVEPPPIQVFEDPQDPMMVALGEAFRARNPVATEVHIVEFRREQRGGGANFVLARAIRPDHVFNGSFEDELFGVFVFDDSLKRVHETLDMFPTPRWRDFDLRIDRTTAESLFVSGQGATQADVPLSRAYRWREAP